jgi:hypothetical protein
MAPAIPSGNAYRFASFAVMMDRFDVTVIVTNSCSSEYDINYFYFYFSTSESTSTIGAFKKSVCVFMRQKRSNENERS